MVGENLVLSSRHKSLLVLVPVLALMMWVTAEVASEEFIIPAVVMLAFVTLVFFSVFVQSVRFEAAVLNLLLVGYLIGNRGFADVTFARPFFPGEIGLVIIATAIIFRSVLTRERIDFSGTLARLIVVFCALGAMRLYLDYSTYEIDAIRDAAIVYYAAYFFFGRQIAIRPEALRIMEKCLQVSFLALVPISIAQRLAPDLLQSNGYMTVIFQKDDLLTTFDAIAVFILYTRPNFYRWKWLRTAMIFFFIIYVVNGITRASLLALIIGSIPLLVAGYRKFLWYPVLAFAIGMTALAGLAVTYQGSRTTDVSVVIEKFISMVDVTGTRSYESDYGGLKASNNEFRRTLWQSFFDDTNQVAPLFGRGFGYDFLARYSDVYRFGEYKGTRAAHNYYVSLYGRMGIIGSIVFLGITWQIIVSGLRAARAVRQGWLPLADLGYWCAAWGILVSAVFGVVLEGPVGAIVFWSFLGVGVRTYQTAEEHLSLAEETPEIEAIPSSAPERPRLGYGAPA